MYLIMADRFCNGNPDNNKIGDSLDQFTAKDLDGRKGGDIEGITSKLDYIKRSWCNFNLDNSNVRK